MDHRLAQALAVFLVVGMTASVASGQFWRRGETDYFISQVQVAGSRIAEQQLSKAKKDLENGELERCVRVVQEVIDDHGARALSTESGRFVGIRDFCNDFIRKLPPEGFATYRRIFDPYARELYERGVSEHDVEALKQVYLRYLNTSYGQESLLAATSILLERGEFFDLVNLCLLYGEIYPDDEEHGGTIDAALLLGARMLGERGRLDEIEATWPSERLRRQVRTGDDSRTLGHLLVDARDALGNPTPPPTAPSLRVFSKPQWTSNLGMAGWKGNATSLLDDFGERASPGNFTWHAVTPAMDDGAVYFSNGISIRSVGLYSGSERWDYRGPVTRSQARRNISLTFPVTVYRNVVYGALETPVAPERRIWSFVPQQPVPHRQLVALDASSGKAIWTHYRSKIGTADEQDFVSSLNVNSAPLAIGEKLFVAATRFHTSYHHYLCCFDRRTGTLEWSTFVCTGQMEQNMFGNRVREAIAGELTEKDGVVYYSTNIGVIAAVDVRLGTLRFTAEYKQIRIPRQTRFDTAIHERAPAWANNPPVIAGNQVYLTPMDCNELLAVNRTSGELRRTGIKRTERNRFRHVVGPYKDLLVIAGAKILFFDTKTGERHEPGYSFGNAARRRQARSVGIQGRPVIVGKNLIAPISGVREEKIYVWDLDRLKLVDEVRLPGGSKQAFGGNLASNGEITIVASTDPNRRTSHVRGYFSRELVRRQLEHAVREAPDNPKTHFRSGEFALQGSTPDYGRALASFNRAWELAGGGQVAYKSWAEKARDALYRLYLDLARRPSLADARAGLTAVQCYERALEVSRERYQKVDILFLLLALAVDQRSDETFNRHLARLTSDYANDPFDYTDLFKRLAPELARSRRYPHAGLVASVVAARYAEKRDRYEDALAHYQTLIRDYPEDIVGSRTAWMYGYSRIEAILRGQGRRLYAKQEDESRQLLQRARESDSTALLQRILDLYPNSTSVSEAYLDISRRHIDHGRHAEAVRSIHEYLWKFGETSPGALRYLAEALEAASCNDSARQVWKRVAELPETRVEGPDGPVDLAVTARRRLETLRMPSRDEHFAAPSFGLDATLAWTAGGVNDAEEWGLLLPRGTAPRVMQGAFLVHRERDIHCFTIANETPRWKFSAKSVQPEKLQWFDDRLIGVVDDDLVCVDPKSGELSWRASMNDYEISAVACGQGKVFTLLTAALGYSASFRLQARSVLDGEIVYDASFDGVPYGKLYVADRWLLVPLENRPMAVVLDAFTGKAAPAFPNGYEYDEFKTPFLNADGLIIAAERDAQKGTADLMAIDPETGRAKWRRGLGDKKRRFIMSDDPYVLMYKESSRREGKALVAIDLRTGTSMLRREFGSEVDFLPRVAMTPNDIFVICREEVRSGQRGLLVYCQDVDLSSSSIRWRTLNFSRINSMEVLPYEEGAVLTVVERVRDAGRRPAYIKTTLYLVEQKSGRVKKEISLDNRGSRFHREILTITGGHLVVVDGPVLKVFKP